MQSLLGDNVGGGVAVCSRACARASVLDKSDCEPANVIEDFFLAFAFQGETEMLVKRGHIWNMLLTASVTDEEAAAVYNVAQKFILLIGGQSRRPSPVVARSQFVKALSACQPMCGRVSTLSNACACLVVTQRRVPS